MNLIAARMGRGGGCLSDLRTRGGAAQFEHRRSPDRRWAAAEPTSSDDRLSSPHRRRGAARIPTERASRSPLVARSGRSRTRSLARCWPVCAGTYGKVHSGSPVRTHPLEPVSVAVFPEEASMDENNRYGLPVSCVGWRITSVVLVWQNVVVKSWRVVPSCFLVMRSALRAWPETGTRQEVLRTVPLLCLGRMRPGL